MAIRMTLLTAEWLVWYYGAHTATPESASGVQTPIPYLPKSAVIGGTWYTGAVCRARVTAIRRRTALAGSVSEVASSLEVDRRGGEPGLDSTILGRRRPWCARNSSSPSCRRTSGASRGARCVLCGRGPVVRAPESERARRGPGAARSGRGGEAARAAREPCERPYDRHMRTLVAYAHAAAGGYRRAWRAGSRPNSNRLSQAFFEDVGHRWWAAEVVQVQAAEPSQPAQSLSLRSRTLRPRPILCPRSPPSALAAVAQAVIGAKRSDAAVPVLTFVRSNSMYCLCKHKPQHSHQNKSRKRAQARA